MVWLGTARRGRQGEVRQGRERSGKAWQARQGGAGHGKARLGKAWQAGQGVARPVTVRQGVAGVAWLGRLGKAGQGSAGRGKAWQAWRYTPKRRAFMHDSRKDGEGCRRHLPVEKW